jgi:hypothetical protein
MQLEADHGHQNAGERKAASDHAPSDSSPIAHTLALCGEE